MVDRYEGFREFVAARGAALSKKAFLLTGDLTASEDLLQEALTKTAAHWPRVNAGDSPEAYVRQVMLNEIRSRWRRGRSGREYATADLPDSPGAADEATQVVQRSVLAKALRQLGPKQRAVLFLRFYEDLSEAETAELLGCSVGTVKRQAHEALARLRRIAPELAPASDIAEAKQ